MKTNWWKWGALTVIAAALFFWGFKCGGDNVKAVVHKDTVRVTVDSGYETVVIDTQYVPKPYKVVELAMAKTETDAVYQHITVDTMAILADYHGQRYYSDTMAIDHGTAVINDTVSQNRITGRSLKVSQRIPVIKETVTLYQPKRNIVYLGVNVQGGPQNYLFAAGADLSLKTKNDRIYSLGASVTRDNQVLYQGGVRFPIRLKIFDRR